MSNSSVITYQAPRGDRIDLTLAQIAMLEAAGKWPRNSIGEEYCSVSHGEHRGQPSMTDEELCALVGL